MIMSILTRTRPMMTVTMTMMTVMAMMIIMMSMVMTIMMTMMTMMNDRCNYNSAMDSTKLYFHHASPNHNLGMI